MVEKVGGGRRYVVDGIAWGRQQGSLGGMTERESSERERKEKKSRRGRKREIRAEGRERKVR